MKLAIVGSCRLEGVQEAVNIINSVIDKYQPDEIVSGGAKGIDTMAVTVASLRNIKTTEFLPKQPKWYWYKKRNLLIAKECDRLIRIVSWKTRTYGSGWTRDKAEELGKPTEEFIIKD